MTSLQFTMDENIKFAPETILSTVCRCCLKSVDSSQVSCNYYDSGQRGVYEEMLKSTFVVNITTQQVSNKYIICKNCALRIKDAAEFKEMVILSEKKIVTLLDTSMKEELDPLTDDELKYEDLNDDSTVMNYDEKTTDYNEILLNIKKGCSRKDGSHKNDILDKKALKQKSSDPTSEVNYDMGAESKKDWTKITERRGNGPILRENSLKLIANSTIFVFQWNKSRYRCFCCKEPFSDVSLLREHTNKNHNLKSIEKIIINQQNRLVKVEVSILNCNICGATIDNLSNLREHLIMEHDFVFKIKEDLLIPFKISDKFTCQLCGENFGVFRLLNIHMNKHFQKQVCHICGTGFSNLVFLNLHKIRSHKPLKCKICGLIFDSKVDKKSHEINIHSIKYERKLRFPCAYCNERFFQENLRVKHLVEKHGLKRPEFKCEICSKSYLTKSLCNNHFKTVHLKEKRHECDVCHNFFYTKSDVARHKISHTGEKKYSCEMCNNPFASKDSLRRHMKRTHGYLK